MIAHGALATPLAQPPADRAVGPDPVGIAAAAGDRCLGRLPVARAVCRCRCVAAGTGSASALSLRLYRVRAFGNSARSFHEMWARLRELPARAGLPATPVPHYVPSAVVNAFATGSKQEASIALTDGFCCAA